MIPAMTTIRMLQEALALTSQELAVAKARIRQLEAELERRPATPVEQEIWRSYLGAHDDEAGRSR